MKRYIALLLVLVMLLGLCACGGEESPAETPAAQQPAPSDKQEEKNDEEEGLGSIEVDEKLFNVEVTLPANFFDGQTAEEIIANAKEQGINKCKVLDDGSVVYTMSKDKHAELMDDYLASVEEAVAALLEGESAVASFLDIQYNEDCSEFNVTVGSGYTVWDLFYGFEFYILGAYYQILGGADPDKVDVVVNFIDEAGNVKDTMSYREFMDNSAESETETEPEENADVEETPAAAGKNLPELIPGESVTIEDECEFYVDFFQIDSRIDPPKPGSWYSYYEAERGKVYVDICVAYKNLDTHDAAADEVMSGKLVYGGKYEYDGFSIIEEGNRDDFTYSNITSIAPLTTGYVHYLFAVPEEVRESEAALWAELNIGGEKYLLTLRSGDENYSVASSAELRTDEGEVAGGELISVPGKCEFFVDACAITERVDPPSPGDWYSYYEAEDGMVYVDLCIGYTNLKKAAVEADDVMTGKLRYAEKYEYDGFSIIEENNRSDFTYTNITDISPLCTEYIHYLFAVPEAVENDDAPIVIDFSIGGSKFSYTVR